MRPLIEKKGPSPSSNAEEKESQALDSAPGDNQDEEGEPKSSVLEDEENSSGDEYELFKISSPMRQQREKELKEARDRYRSEREEESQRQERELTEAGRSTSEKEDEDVREEEHSQIESTEPQPEDKPSPCVECNEAVEDALVNCERCCGILHRSCAISDGKSSLCVNCCIGVLHGGSSILVESGEDDNQTCKTLCQRPTLECLPRGFVETRSRSVETCLSVAYAKTSTHSNHTSVPSFTQLHHPLDTINRCHIYP